jgi:hypothetical protein
MQHDRKNHQRNRLSFPTKTKSNKLVMEGWFSWRDRVQLREAKHFSSTASYQQNNHPQTPAK